MGYRTSGYRVLSRDRPVDVKADGADPLRPAFSRARDRRGQMAPTRFARLSAALAIDAAPCRPGTI